VEHYEQLVQSSVVQVEQLEQLVQLVHGDRRTA